MPQTTIRTYVEWRLTSATKFNFLELINEYEQVDEDSDEAEAIRDMMQTLPGYPTGCPEESDILLVVTDIQH